MAAWLQNCPKMHPQACVTNPKAMDLWRESGNSTPRKFSTGEWTEEMKREKHVRTAVKAVSLESRS